jgi:Tol biopolymer transport system component/DNA-binding winged helix-turn-helix (wHTH) protein
MRPLPPRFRLNGRLVEPSLNRVTANGTAVQVEPKIMSVLVALAEQPGDVVTRDALMRIVWPDVFVTEDVLHRAVRELRRLFDDDTGSPRVIETIRKRGYRLVAPIEEEAVPPLTRAQTQPERASRWPAAVAAVGGAAIVAVIVWTARRPSSPTVQAVRFIPLTSAPGNEVDPALSRSGALAYVARAADGRGHLFVRRTTDPEGNQITTGNGREIAPVWAPDERTIAFVRVEGADCGIWTVDMLRRSERRASPCLTRASTKMAWSPDGRFVAVSADGAAPEAPRHIELLDMQSGNHREITDPPSGQFGDDSPSFSPDGLKLAFVRSISPSIGDIYVASTAGGPARRLTADDGDILGQDWEADGRSIVFSSERGGGISLWRISTTGGEPTFVAGGGAKLKHPTVARGTGAIAFEDWHYEINLVDAAANPGSGAAAPIAPTSDQWNFHPQISPDGTRIAFQSTRSGQYEIWIARRDGSNARQLTRSGSYKSPPRWSPDGTRIVFATRLAETAQLIALNVESGAADTLATDADAVVAPSWSHDGRRVYFGALRNGAWHVASAGLSGERPAIVLPDAYAAAEAPDAGALYYVRLDRRGLWRHPLSGGANDLVTPAVQAEDWPNLALIGPRIFFVARPDDQDPQLMVIDRPGAPPRPLARLPEFAWNGIAVSADGTRVLYAHTDRREANIEEIVR